MLKVNIRKTIPILFFIAFFVMGIFIYDDFGISTDEVQERRTTLVNAKYIMNTFGYDGLSDMDENLLDYKDKYYGVFLQLPCVAIEWLTGFEDSPSIYLYRHLYVFGICILGYLSFYLLCMRLTRSNCLSLLGTIMLAFYPRFFANQFYDIKDMIFASMYMVCMWVTVETISKKLHIKWLVIFAILSAIATNVRIIGAIFPILLIGYILLTWIIGKCGIDLEDRYTHPLRSTLIILFVYIGSYIAMMPILWNHPIMGIVNAFRKFSRFDDWNGHVVFMGELVRGSEVPWYYVPIWLLISVPIWYWLLLLVAFATLGIVLVRGIKQKRKISWVCLLRYKYLIWAVVLAVGPWVATVVFHSTLYNAWRHCFFLLPPIVFTIIYSLYLIKNKIGIPLCFRICLTGVIIFGLINQSLWIVKNHPYQMVYLNPIGRVWGSQFDRDYWCLATTDMCRYVLENDSSEKISINAPFNMFERLLNEEEKDRIVIEENPTYWLESYRKIIGDDYVREGYEEIYTIVVDGYKIGSVQKRIDA